MSSDIVVTAVTCSARELMLRLAHQWAFVAIERDQVRMFGEPIAHFAKRGPKVHLRPMGPRELCRWAAWAIQSCCPESVASDEEADPPTFEQPPMAEQEVERVARGLRGARRAAIAKAADPSGGAHEAVALVLYLVEHELLELNGEVAAVVRAVAPLLQDVDENTGAKLEDALLDLGQVDELYAEPGQIAKIIAENHHVLSG